MSRLSFFGFLISIILATCLPGGTAPKMQDPAMAQTIKPDSLRVTIDPGVFRWLRFRYEAEVRVSAFYPPGSEAAIPESLRVFVDVQPQGVTFWKKGGQKDAGYVPTDYLTIYRDQVQAKGLVRWLLSGQAVVTAQAGTMRETVTTIPNFPVLLFLVCVLGGGVGGWLRKMRDPSSVVDIPVRLLPKKLSRLLEPVREIFISMVAGLLLYLLNLVSPVYLEFRLGFEAGWLVLVQPLLIGFIGGWSGIYLLVSLLNQLFKSGKVEPVVVDTVQPAPGKK